MGRLSSKRNLKACDPSSRKKYAVRDDLNDEPYASSDEEGWHDRPPPGGWPSLAHETVRPVKKRRTAPVAAEPAEPAGLSGAALTADAVRRAANQARKQAKRDARNASAASSATLQTKISEDLKRKPTETLREHETRVRQSQRAILNDHVKKGLKSTSKKKAYLVEKKKKKQKARQEKLARGQGLATRAADRGDSDGDDEFPEEAPVRLNETNASVPRLSVKPRKAPTKSAAQQARDRELAMARTSAITAYKQLKEKRAAARGGGPSLAMAPPVPLE